MTGCLRLKTISGIQANVEGAAFTELSEVIEL